MINVYHTMDNFSRFVFPNHASLNLSGKLSRELIEGVLDDNSEIFVGQTALLVDGGSEFQGDLDSLVQEYPGASWLHTL